MTKSKEFIIKAGARWASGNPLSPFVFTDRQGNKRPEFKYTEWSFPDFSAAVVNFSIHLALWRLFRDSCVVKDAWKYTQISLTVKGTIFNKKPEDMSNVMSLVYLRSTRTGGESLFLCRYGWQEGGSHKALLCASGLLELGLEPSQSAYIAFTLEDRENTCV